MLIPLAHTHIAGATSPVDYNVTVKVAPSTANVKFYSCHGFDENKKDILGEEITATDVGVVDKYHQYSLVLKEGRYSFRGADADGASLGGMTFTIPPANAAEATEYTITLRQVDVYTTTKYDGTNYATENEYTTTVADYEENFATAGAPYKKGNYTRYPYLLYALGNPLPYSIELIPNAETAESYSLGTNTMLGYAVSAGTSIATKSGAIPTLLNAVINAPKGANVQVFKQIKNFYRQEVECSSVTDSENGTVDYTYRLPKDNSSHTYRASMEGKITKAGFLSLKTEESAKTTISFAENEDPKTRPEYDRSTPMGKRGEDSIVLNINKQNYLRLNQGEEFTARAYRAVQIINSNTGNVTIEPDFHYDIISGDSITLEQQGHKAVLKAVKDGISIIEVTYDAIEVTGSASYSGLYGAIDPSRKGLFVVNVGGDTSTAIDMTDWDSDFDTVYFLGERGKFSFAPASNEVMTVEADGTSISANAGGTYTIPIKRGNNLITVTAGSTTEYLVVKGDKLTANIANVTNPDSPIKQGDTIQVSFDGLHMPIPKMGGMYNPGYKSTIKAEYTLPDGSKITSGGAQYDFISNHTITITVYDEGILKLTGGSIPMTCMGMEIGGHRSITDTGIPANFNASEIAGRYCILPDMEIEVLKTDKVIVKETVFEGSKATVTFISPKEAQVNIFVGAYEDIYLDGITCTSAPINEGETPVNVDFSAVAEKDNLYMLIWDNDMTEITGKTVINTKD